MKFYTKTHKHYCGIDLHIKNLYVCILDQEGEVLIHKNIKANPKALMTLIKPFLDGLVIGVECMFSWYWVADFCEDNQIIQGTQYSFIHHLRPRLLLFSNLDSIAFPPIR